MSNPITSSRNPHIQQLIRLKERKERDSVALFLIEGYREIHRAVQGRIRFQSLFISPSLFLGKNEAHLIAQIGIEPFTLPAHLFEKISYRDRPDGLIVIAHQMHTTLADLRPQQEPPLYVVAEAIEKPGNLGTILRSADAVGASGVIVADRCTDIYNPNVVRASVGTLFTLPVVEAKGADAYLWLKGRGVSVVAATPSATLEYTKALLHGPIAVVVGTEQIGLSDVWMAAADLHVKIPMHGVADSLNVAMATTLLLYEVLRQRTHHLRRQPPPRR